MVLKADLHESLRQPLKRLSNRQLALLLKQVRKQRRKQERNGETEASINGNEEIEVEDAQAYKKYFLIDDFLHI